MFGAVLALLLLELSVRLLLGNKFEMAKFYYKAHSLNGHDLSLNFPPFNDEIEGHKFKYWSNNLGCFDNDYREETPYGLLVGDSFTWAGFGPFSDTWGMLIEKYTGMRILKCGVSGYGTAQELQKAKEIIQAAKTPPKVLLVGYFEGNDVLDDYLVPEMTVVAGSLVSRKKIADLETGRIERSSDQDFEEKYKNFTKYCRTFTPRYPLLTRLSCYFKKHLVIFPAVRNFISRFLDTSKITGQAGNGSKNTQTVNPIGEKSEFTPYVPQTNYPWLEKAWNNHLENLGNFKKFTDSVGAELVVILIPSKETLYPDLQAEVKKIYPDLDFLNPHKTIKNFLEKRNINYVDMLAISREFSGDLGNVNDTKGLYWSVNRHWNIRGNRLAGLTVSKFLLEHGFLATYSEIKNKLLLKEVDESLLDLK